MEGKEQRQIIPMRKVILNIAVSLDGYIEGPNGEYDWCFADQDYGMSTFFEQIELIFMGSKSYNLIKATGDINAFPQTKCVFSDSLQPGENPDVEIIRKSGFKERVLEIKNEFGGDIWLFGGADLMSSFLKENLIDDFIISIHPIILNGGKLMFTPLNALTQLIHTGTETYSSGLVQARYTLKPVFDMSVLDRQLAE